MHDRYEPNPAATDRDNGLRRLSRLTWRSAQLGALAAAAFAILFARTAPTHATSQAPVPPTHSPFPATEAAPTVPRALRHPPSWARNCRRP
jgi:hypothetical protein